MTLRVHVSPLRVRLRANMWRSCSSSSPSKESFRGTFQLFTNAVILFLAVVYIAILSNALCWSIHVSHVISVAVGLLLAVLGSELDHVQPNRFVGSARIASGRVLFIAGAVIIVAILVLPSSFAAFVMLIVLLGAVASTVGYSYVIWRQLYPSA